MSSTEMFTTTSGKEVTINISEAGEPESITFEGVVISENEVFEISEYLDDYGEEDENDDNDNTDSAEDEASENHELT